MKRLLLLTNNGMTGYDWARGRFRQVQAFAANPEGRQTFAGYLLEQANRPVRLLLELVEDNFRSASIPQVFGRDRTALTERLLAKHYRGTSYSRMVFQGRESSGRKDAKVLLAGLGNAETLKPWLQIISDCETPLQGIYSLPLISESLLSRQAARSPHGLLMSQQSPDRLRQCYYQFGRLKLSRQTPIRLRADESVANFFGAETRNMLRYLESQRLLRRSEQIQVQIIAPYFGSGQESAQLANDDQVCYEVIETPELARAIGIKGELPTPYGDCLFAHQLLRRPWLRDHYASPGDRRHYLHRIAHGVLNTGAVTALVSGITIGAVKLIDGQMFERYAGQLTAEFSRLKATYGEPATVRGAFPVEPAVVADTVKLVERLDRMGTRRPHKFMSQVGALLYEHPAINLKKLSWSLADTPATTPEEVGTKALFPLEDPLTKGPRYELAWLSGQIESPHTDYRQTMESFNAFLDGLRTSGYFDELRVLRSPFNLGAATTLLRKGAGGDTSNDTNQAIFELLLRTN
jgi:hypothetical protein